MLPGADERTRSEVTRLAHADLADASDAAPDHDQATRLELGGALPDAARRGQLGLHYQPIVDLRPGEAARLEALLRWRHPGVGAVAPLELRALAQQCQLGAGIDRWVFANVIAQASTWRRTGIALGTTINVSLADMAVELMETLAGVLQQRGLRAREFTLDISADEITPLSRRNAHALSVLVAAGFRLAVEGVTAAPTRATSVFFDELKVSSALVRRSASDPVARLQLRTLAAAARDLGLGTIAVAVEDESTMAELTELGYTAAQGYAVSRRLATREHG